MLIYYFESQSIVGRRSLLLWVEGVDGNGECCRCCRRILCALKARHLFCNWKFRLAFSSSRRSFRESTSSMLPYISDIAGWSGTGGRVCCFRYFRSSLGIFSWNPAAWLTFFTGQDVCSQPTIILGSSFKNNQKITKRSFHNLFVLILKKIRLPGIYLLRQSQDLQLVSRILE